MVIISNMDTQIYDIYHLNLTMETNGKVCHLLIIMLITAFYPKYNTFTYAFII